MKSSELPRLLYIADVPVEASYHGSALIHRLLEEYPKDRLRVVEAGTALSLPERRLKEVAYHDMRPPFTRLQSTRFAGLYEDVRLSSVKLSAMMLKPMVAAFKPEAVLTVTDGVSWIVGARLASQLNAPLHLICHDEWVRGTGDQKEGWRERVFGEIYRQAASRLCVSPFMIEDYTRRFGASGTLLYPSRAKSTAHFVEPPERLGQQPARFTCVFAGNIFCGSVFAALRRISSALIPLDGKLMIFGPLSAAQARTKGLDAANIEFGGLLSSARLLEVLRERADALVVPMSFEAAARTNMETSFPSKLADYTAAGVPLLIYGPDYCSAVRWARDNGGVAEVVASEDDKELVRTVGRLAADAPRRVLMAKAALAAGKQYFSYEAASNVFRMALSGLTHRSI